MKTSGTRIEDTDINPHNYAYLIFDRGIPKQMMEKRQPFQQVCWENWISTCRKLKVEPCLSQCANINSKWVKDLNIRPKTLKLA
jgi:hypothetical protein